VDDELLIDHHQIRRWIVELMEKGHSSRTTNRKISALKTYFRQLYDQGAGRLRYAVLVGEGSFDYRDLLGNGDSLVPPWMAATEQGLFGSDLGYGDLDGSGLPKVAVGRIPVANAAELDAYIAKLSSRAAQGTETLLWAADNPDAAGDFPADMRGLADLAPDGVPDVRIDLGQLGLQGARTAFVDAWNVGASLVSYLGHGSVTRLAHEGLLTNGDVPALGGAQGLPVFAALSCVVNRFELSGYDAFGETLVVAEDAGAVASLAPAALSRHGGAALLGKALMRAIYGHGAVRLGDALLLAMQEYRGTGANPDLLRTYNLLGDPAVTVRSAYLDPGLVEGPLMEPPPTPVDDGPTTENPDERGRR
jgi:hypothetical protein